MCIYRLLKQFFKREKEVPKELCIAFDNLFMNTIEWITADYIVHTGIFKSGSLLTLENSVVSFKDHDKYLTVWENFAVSLLGKLGKKN